MATHALDETAYESGIRQFVGHKTMTLLCKTRPIKYPHPAQCGQSNKAEINPIQQQHLKAVNREDRVVEIKDC
jgi:hypothetical protein